MPSGYEAIYLKLIPRLAGCDFAESAERLGLELTKEGHIRAGFLGREYLVTKEGVKSADGQSTDVNNLSVLLYYVLSRGSGRPKNSFVPLFRLAGMLEGRSRLSDILNDPLTREFGNDYQRFSAAALKLGGTCENGSVPGRHEWLFLLLPRIPAKVIFHEADEEFPAEIQIMLDVTAPRFLEFECLAFLTGCFVNTMMDKVR